MRQSIWLWAAPLIAVFVMLGVYVWYDRAREPAPVPAPSEPVAETPPPVPVPPPEPAAELPEELASLPPPEPDPAVELPPIQESDPLVKEWLSESFGAQAVEEILRPERLVRRFVVSIDNLPREQVALAQLPLRDTPGRFIASGPEGDKVLGPENYARYDAFVDAFEKVDAAMLVAAYHRAYPLLQQAYEDLGYPGRSFNTRLLEVIEHLLATPDVTGPLKLVQPHVLYQFADPELEALSAGQKALLRMGPENAAAVKAKLREIRAELIAQAPESGSQEQVPVDTPDAAPQSPDVTRAPAGVLDEGRGADAPGRSAAADTR
ncbi:MAG TPA: DUF3014 domain-containing protein [Gammaproteobacteria bacterium]